MTRPTPRVRLLVCGSADRGDDGAALLAAAHVLPALSPEIRDRLEVRRCSQLDPSDLIAVREGESCLVVDTVFGVEPGAVVVIPLAELMTAGGVNPRSSHALPIDQVVGIAEAIRGGLPPGMFVGIGGKWFGFGEMQSRAVRSGMLAFERAILDGLRELVALAPA